MIVFGFHRLPEWFLILLISGGHRIREDPVDLAKGESCGALLDFLYACYPLPIAVSGEFNCSVSCLILHSTF